MINAREYAHYDGLGLAQLVRAGEVSAIELLEAALARSSRVNPLINAIVLSMEEEARRAIAEGLPAGPFSGVPYLLKDFQARCTAACRRVSAQPSCATSSPARTARRWCAPSAPGW